MTSTDRTVLRHRHGTRKMVIPRAGAGVAPHGSVIGGIAGDVSAYKTGTRGRIFNNLFNN